MMGKKIISAVAIAPLLLGIVPAFAQQARQPQLPESTSAIVNWRNLESAMTLLIQANEQRAVEIEKMKQDAAALAAFWASYVAGLSPKK